MGRPGGEVTQEEYDAIVAVIAEDAAITTDQRLKFDVNNDGLVNQGDLDIIQGGFGDGQVYTEDPSGLYAAGIDTRNFITDDLDRRDLPTQGAINQGFEGISQQATNQGLLGLIGSGNLDPLTHTTSAPSVANINYVYDPFGENIFATDQQAALFGSPYGSGQSARQNQIAQEGVKRSNAVGFGGLAQGGEVKYDFKDNIARIMSYGDN